jgi:hypothetical protein
MAGHWYRDRDGEMDFDDGEDGVLPSSQPASAPVGMGQPALAGICQRCDGICEADRTLCDLCVGMPGTLHEEEPE